MTTWSVYAPNHDSPATRRSRERRFHLITDVSSPRRHRTTTDGFMLFPRLAYGRSIGLCATTRPTTSLGNALNGPIYHRPTLIRLWQPPPPLPLLRLSKFTFLAASLGSRSFPDRPPRAADMRARGRRKNLPVRRQVGRRGVVPARPDRALFRRAAEQRRC